MISIMLDEKGYWTGGAVEKEYGVYENGIWVDSIPDEEDFTRRRAYKFEKGKFIFDEDRYIEVLAEVKAEEEISRISIEDRITALEEAMLEMITGGAV